MNFGSKQWKATSRQGGPLDRLRHHVTGAIERGEKEPIVEQRDSAVPPDWPVQPLKEGEPAKDRATCGHCGRSWDDGIVTSMTPAPSARCPFEVFHVYKDE